MRDSNARLSARNASAVVGAIGMKRGEGVRKSDQPAVHPASTTTLCSVTNPAATTAARVRTRSARAVLICSRLKNPTDDARSRLTTFCVSGDTYSRALLGAV